MGGIVGKYKLPNDLRSGRKPEQNRISLKDGQKEVFSSEIVPSPIDMEVL